uniref:Uncharacterized protein n=1 Tax=Streptomyces phage Scarif TaxID=3158858 RepID=A0AAU7GZR8_9CAUD
MSELIHYGVKGMKWGVRKNPKDDSPNSNYSRGQRSYDRKNHGKGGVKRINRRLNEGQDLKTARKNEYKFRRKRATMVSAGIVAARYAPTAIQVLKMVGGVASQKVALRAEAKRGQAAAAASMGIPRQGSTGPSYTKKNRKGVYNISSM